MGARRKTMDEMRRRETSKTREEKSQAVKTQESRKGEIR
jgi:hypothetical protein